MIPCEKDRTVNITYLEAPLEKVWWSIVTPPGTNTYLTYTADTTGDPLHPKVGDIFTLCYGDIINRSEVIACEKHQSFALKDAYESIAPDGSTDHFFVTTHFRLEQEGAFVKLTLEVTGFQDDEYGQWFRECLEMGWRRSLMNLKSVLELGMDLRAEMFSYPRLGVVNCTVNQNQSISTGVPVRQGNYLLEVFPNSPADAAGLMKGDVIVAFDDVPTPAYEDFVRAISFYYGKDSQVTIRYIRNGEEKRTVARLSIEDTFTGRVELEGTSLEEIKQKRERLARQRSASGAIWKEQGGLSDE